MSGVYQEGSEFSGVIGRTVAESSPAWPAKPFPGAPAKNLVLIVLDDLGFGQLGCYGGLGRRISTPNIDRLAAEGLRYNNFHVSPMCSPTRAALLSGRNSHSVGVGKIMESSRGYPGHHGRIMKDTALLPAVLSELGYTCYALGKWHLTPADEITPIGPFDRWPLGQGFHRFYGFHGGATHQWDPVMWEDNHCIGNPALSKEGYHLSEDLVDHAIRWTEEHRAVAPSRPYFLYLSFGAMHQPHHVAEEWVEPYRGRFSAGWEVVRAENLEAQKELGIVPDDTILPPPNRGVPVWEELPRDVRRLMERQMEVYAGFLSHTDAQIGRVLDDLERRAIKEETLTMLLSDNGSSGEGGPLGRFGLGVAARNPAQGIDETIRLWGGPDTYPNYATGWAMAGNSPNRWYKQFAHEGGTRAPLVVSWSSGIDERGGIRAQFHAAPDVVPTILEVFGLEVPKVVAGVAQRSLEGMSFAYTLDDAKAPTRKVSQYFEMFGHRAIWSRGWKAVAAHWTEEVESMFLGSADGPWSTGVFGDAEWELYHLDKDFSECRNLASEEPEMLRQLIELWWSEAGRYRVLPLDDHMGFGAVPRRPEAWAHRIFEQRDVFTYFSRVELPPAVSPGLSNRAHRIEVECDLEAGTDSGVLVSDGGPEGGYSLCVVDGAVHYVGNRRGELTVLRADKVGPGALRIAVHFEKTAEHEGAVQLVVNGQSHGPVPLGGKGPIRFDRRGGGFRVGSDPGGVWDAYGAPFPYAGRIHKVTVHCLGEEHRDLVAELKLHLAEQ